MDDLSTLAGRLTYALRWRDMDQIELDRRLGKPRGGWASRVCAGLIEQPRSRTIAEAARVLDVPREWLEDGVGDSGIDTSAGPVRRDTRAQAVQPKQDPRYAARRDLIIMLGARLDPRERAALLSTELGPDDSGDAAWWRARYAAIRADRIATDELLAALDAPVPAAVERPVVGAKAKARKKGA